MNPRVEARLAKVRHLSRVGNVLCIAAMALTCVVTCIIVAAGLAAPDEATCNFGAGPAPCSSLGGGALALTFSALTVFAALFLKGLYHLSRLFRNFARGEIFTRESVLQIRKIGSTVFAFGVFQIVVLLAAFLLPGIHQVWPEDRPLPLPFAAFVGGALIMLVSWVMEVGTDLREESELTV